MQSNRDDADYKPASGRERIGWVDAARGIGIATVFFGHYLQDASANHPAAMDDLRFLYSFHVPFFFILSGCLAHRERTFFAQLRTLATRRLLPVLFFGVCFGSLDILLQLRHGHFGTVGLKEAATGYLIGRPLLDWATWFLVCLFVCEMIAYMLLPHLRTRFAQITAGLLAISTGAYFGNHSNLPTEGFVFYLGEFWFFSEAITALGFYLVGHALWPWLRLHLNSVRTAGLFTVGGLLIVLLTFQHNTSGGQPVVVMMAARSHGTVFWFCITSLAGSMALMGAGSLLSRWRLLQLAGRNTIALLGLNGLFFGNLNPLVVRYLHTPATHAGVVAIGLLVTSASMVLCIPMVALMQALLPQLVGSPRRVGPLLPALE